MTRGTESRQHTRGGLTVAVPAWIRPRLEAVGALAERRSLTAYAVGACVRDWLLGIRRTVDVDVVVAGDGVAFAQALAHGSGAALIVHPQFGTATLVWKTRLASVKREGKEPVILRLDVASCRKERYREPAAYPKVSPGSLEEDLARRDFTINAMAMALNPDAFGRLVDPCGGLKDLRARRLRVLHSRSFEDDPSRLLRAARFLERFHLALDPTTERSLRRAMADGLLARLNRGRLHKELQRMLQEPAPVACLVRVGRWLARDDRRRDADRTPAP